MIRAFAGNQSLFMVFIPMLFGLNILLHNFFNIPFLVDDYVFNLWGIDITTGYSGFDTFLVLFFISANALGINYIFNVHEFYERNTYLPALIYTILVCFFPFSAEFGNTLMSQSFFICAIYFFIHIRQNEAAKSLLFNAGFFVALASSVQVAFFLLLPVMWIGVFSIRTFSFKELLISIFGFVTPYLWLWYFNPIFIEQFTSENYLQATTIYPYFSVPVFVFAFILIFIAYLGIRNRFLKSSVRFRRIMNMLATMFIYVSLVNILAVVYIHSYTYLAVGIPVLALVIPYAYIDNEKSSISAVILYLLMSMHFVKFLFG